MAALLRAKRLVIVSLDLKDAGQRRPLELSAAMEATGAGLPMLPLIAKSCGEVPARD